MKENVDNNIEKLIDKVMSNVALDSPSFNFTSNVMSQVKQTSQSKATVYEPLISKKVWGVIFVAIIALVVYSLFYNNPQSSGFLSKIDLSALKFSNPLSEFKFSTITMYALLFLSIMVCVQIPMLKNYFNKRTNL